MIKIELRLFASLRKYMPGASGSNPCIVDISEGSTVESLLKQTNIPSQECKIIFLNGVHAKTDQILKDGDRLGIFPAIAGG